MIRSLPQSRTDPAAELRQELSDAQDTIDLLLRRNEYLEGSMDDEELK